MISTKSGALSEAALAAHEAFVRKLARRLVRDEHQADDLVQETWLAALRQPDAVRGSLRAWLARVMGNLARRASLACAARTREAWAARDRPKPSIADVAARASGRIEIGARRVDARRAVPQRGRDALLRRLGPSEIAAPGRAGRDRAHAPQTRARDPAPAFWSAAALARRCGLGRCWLRARAALRDRVAALATRARSSPFASKAALALLLPLLWIAWVLVVGPGSHEVAGAAPSLRVEAMAENAGNARELSNKRVALPSSEELSTTATAAALRELTGRTWDENGRPLAGVELRWWSGSGSTTATRRRGYSDAAGRYELRGLPRRSSSMRSTRHGMRSDAGGTRARSRRLRRRRFPSRPAAHDHRLGARRPRSSAARHDARDFARPHGRRLSGQPPRRADVLRPLPRAGDHGSARRVRARRPAARHVPRHAHAPEFRPLRASWRRRPSRP